MVNTAFLKSSIFFSPSLLDWVTDDLLAKIKTHPLLSRVFQDPRLAQVIAQFQSNPQAAMVATRNNPEVSQNLSGEFHEATCSMRGCHHFRDTWPLLILPLLQFFKLHFSSFPLQLREVLQEFCTLMGEHFTVLADKEEKQTSSKHTPLISEASASGTNYDVTLV